MHTSSISFAVLASRVASTTSPPLSNRPLASTAAQLCPLLPVRHISCVLYLVQPPPRLTCLRLHLRALVVHARVFAKNCTPRLLHLRLLITEFFPPLQFMSRKLPALFSAPSPRHHQQSLSNPILHLSCHMSPPPLPTPAPYNSLALCLPPFPLLHTLLFFTTTVFLLPQRMPVCIRNTLKSLPLYSFPLQCHAQQPIAKPLSSHTLLPLHKPLQIHYSMTYPHFNSSHTCFCPIHSIIPLQLFDLAPTCPKLPPLRITPTTTPCNLHSTSHTKHPAIVKHFPCTQLRIPHNTRNTHVYMPFAIERASQKHTLRLLAKAENGSKLLRHNNKTTILQAIRGHQLNAQPINTDVKLGIFCSEYIKRAENL